MSPHHNVLATHKGHDDLTSSPPSSELTPAVSHESPPSRAGNMEQGLRSLRDLTQHLTTRADDSHAPPAHRPQGKPHLCSRPVHVKPREGSSRCTELIHTLRRY